ncbi:hypothetical protein GCM10027088_60140 [Nocardia goodfellowii]
MISASPATTTNPASNALAPIVTKPQSIPAAAAPSVTPTNGADAIARPAAARSTCSGPRTGNTVNQENANRTPVTCAGTVGRREALWRRRFRDPRC